MRTAILSVVSMRSHLADGALSSQPTYLSARAFASLHLKSASGLGNWTLLGDIRFTPLDRIASLFLRSIAIIVNLGNSDSEI